MMPTAKPSLLIWGSSKIVWIAASCGQVAKVSACLSVLGWFESMSCQSVERCAWDGGEDAWKSWRKKNEESKENGERQRGREGEDYRASKVYILCPSGIVMTSQSQSINRVDRSNIPITVRFSSNAQRLSHFTTCIFLMMLKSSTQGNMC